MGISKEQFGDNLKRATEAARRTTSLHCWNPLPPENRYFVLLNGSYDGHPLASDEHLFPDHQLPQLDSRTPRTENEVVEKLWRSGMIPEWIDITPYEIQGDALHHELLCCGRFTDQERLLYHEKEGYPPFHLFGPVWPAGDYDFVRNGKFDLHSYRDRKNTNQRA